VLIVSANQTIAIVITSHFQSDALRPTITPAVTTTTAAAM